MVHLNKVCNYFKDPVLSIMLHTPCTIIVFVCMAGVRILLFSGELLFSWLTSSCIERNYKLLACASVLFKFVILKYILKCCLINKVLE